MKVIIEGEDFDDVINFDIDKGFIVEGIAYVSFFRIQIIGQKEKIFEFWYNTNSYLIILIFMNSKKREIDKACKDKNSKYYRYGFRIEIHFSDV